MFLLEDGRDSFYQWDANRRLIIKDDSITEVHFCNRTDECSLVVEVYEENGIRLANVPNILLQMDWRINVYAFDKDYTKHCATFKVNARTRPDDYIYEETEVLNYNTLAQRVGVLENSEEVYIGYEQPTDSSIKLWIDPDDAMDNSNVDVDLTGYATEEYVNDAISAINIPDTSGFITMEDVEAKDYALKTDIPDTSGYALKSDIPDTSGLATEQYVDDAISAINIPEVDLSNYYNKEEVDAKIPDTSGLTTMAAVEAKGYQTEAQVNTLINTALGVIENGTY